MMQMLSFSRRQWMVSGGTFGLMAAGALYVLIGATPAHACAGGNYNFNENYNFNSNTNYNSNSTTVTIRRSVSS
ncbi:MAG: hypothetical protein WCY02_08200 [Parvibaculum sp.]